MNMSSESLLVILFVGLVAGWLAGQIVRGTGFKIVGDLIIGILGAFIGSWLLPQLGIHLGSGIISAIVNATIGAVLLLFVVRLFRGGGGWGKQMARSLGVVTNPCEAEAVRWCDVATKPKVGSGSIPA